MYIIATSQVSNHGLQATMVWPRASSKAAVFASRNKQVVQIPLQWRHNERDSVSNHRRLDCLFKHFFGPRSKKTSLWGESTGHRWIPLTKGKWRGKYFRLMTSPCEFYFRMGRQCQHRWRLRVDNRAAQDVVHRLPQPTHKTHFTKLTYQVSIFTWSLINFERSTIR